MKLELRQNGGPYQLEPGRCKKKLTPDQVRTKDWGPSYVAEPKLDGIRYLWQLRPRGATQNFLTSRRISVQTKLYVQKEDKVPWLRDFVVPSSLFDTVLDGELTGGSLSCDTQHLMVEDSNSLVYTVFDVLFFRGEDVRSKPKRERHELLVRIVRKLLGKDESTQLKAITPWAPVTTLLSKIKDEGGEGIVIKDSEAPYGEGWIKVPFEGDPADCVIVGYKKSEEGQFAKRGLIGAIELAQWVPNTVLAKLEGKLKVVRTKGNRSLLVVGTASGFDVSQREKFTFNQEEYLGNVVEIEYKTRFVKTGRFRHIRFSRFRFDKDAKDAFWDGK